MSTSASSGNNLHSLSSKPRHVWIVNHHAEIPSKDDGSGRHLNLLRELEALGWTGSIVLSGTTHPDGLQRMEPWKFVKQSREFGVPCLWIRTAAYRDSNAMRLLGMLEFAGILLIPGVTRRLQAPDLIIGSTVHPFAAWAAARLARRKGVPFVYEIRDVWPETLVDFGKLSPKHPLVVLIRYISTSLATSARAVISPLPNIDRYLKELGITDPTSYWISNGFMAQSESPLPTLPSPRDTFTFMYLGSHGYANALDQICYAFSLACQSRPDLPLRLRFVGSGPLKGDLVKYVETLPFGDRIVFEDRIPGRDVIGRARQADALVATVRDLRVYKYGIAMNKLFAYLYAHRPVIIATNAPNNPISDAHAGLTTPADDVHELANGMIQMATAPAPLREQWARNGYEHVLAEYTFKRLGRRLRDALDSCL